MQAPSILLRATVLLTAGMLIATPAVRAETSDGTCPQTSPKTTYSGNTLDTSTPVKNGIVFSSSNGTARLQVESGTGLFKATGLGTSDQTVFAAPADFNNDGWTDFVGTGETNGFLKVYRNTVASTPEPNWDDVNAVRQSSFTASTQLVASVNSTRWRPTAAGDFNGDGWPDVVRAEASQYGQPSTVQIWLNAKLNDASGNPSFLAPYAAMASGSTPSQLQYQNWGGTNIFVTDYNGDRKLDILVGGASASSGGTASIRIFLNQCTLVNPLPTPLPATGPLPCATNPTFATLMNGANPATLGPSALGFPATAGNVPVFAYRDVDGDGNPDLVVGSPACCSTASTRLRYYKGISGGNVDSTSPQTIDFPGGATAVFLADFSGDGKLDLIVGTDNFNYNSGFGAWTYYWVNNGQGGNPFSNAPTILTNQSDKALVNPATGTTTADFDVGFVFDYDHDPNHSSDLMIADGNHSASFFVLANRAVAQYAQCGTAESSVMPLGNVPADTVITAARIHPQVTLNGGTATFYLSNETPSNWVQASDCGDNSGDLCATFPKPIGHDIRWKVQLCSNPLRTRTPQLTSLDLAYDYTQATDHFRSGVIVSDGVAYMAGFRQPGYRGHLFAVNASLNRTYWDAATAIDAVADGSRKIYTSTVAGNARLDFTTANASLPAMQSTLGVAGEDNAKAIISWVRSARFGITGLAKSRLGAVETSTPAIMTPPGLPIWWVYASILERSRHDQFRAAQANRPQLVLFGARDAMIHAVRTVPTSITTAPSGTEAWAYIPSKIASSLAADYTDSLTSGTTVARSYPDGSPTLADYRKTDGTYGTIALVASGNGGQSLIALDVTRTVDPSTGAVVGPTPLWEAIPGGADAGQGLSKPILIRVRIAGAERFIAVAASGLSPDNPTAPWTKGRIVTAYDAPTGAVLWKFKAACPVTSDLMAFETDDAGEQGSPTFDGYMDRVMFGDACGNLYKVDPGRSLGDHWNDNSGLGTYEVEAPAAGVRQFALFSTKRTNGALGSEAPIAGTLAATADATGRMTVFFGTGGLESFPTTTRNEFYAVYADDGSVRSKMQATCQGGRCEKFYGGALVTQEQVIFTRTMDPSVGTGTCDRGSSTVEVMQLAAGTNASFAEVFNRALGSAVMGSIYGDAGALYFANYAGQSVRLGTPRAGEAGVDSQTHNAPVLAQTPTRTGTTAALSLLGWRQVF